MVLRAGAFVLLEGEKVVKFKLPYTGTDIKLMFEKLDGEWHLSHDYIESLGYGTSWGNFGYGGNTEESIAYLRNYREQLAEAMREVDGKLDEAIGFLEKEAGCVAS